MSQTYAVPIDREWSQVTFNHEFLTTLSARNLEPEIQELYSVGTIRYGSDESSGYVMARVSHLTAPLDEVDVVDANRKQTYICGCANFHFDCYDQQVGVKVDDCKHICDVKEQRKEALPDEQSTLIP